MKPLLIIDGYNVIGAWSEARNLSPDESRDKLLKLVEDYAGYKEEEVVLVYDGYKSDRKETTREQYGDVTVVFTKKGETADSYIEFLAAHVPKYRKMYVATSDSLVQSQAFSTGAIRMSSREFLRELKEIRASEYNTHGMTQALYKNTATSACTPEQLEILEQIRRQKK